MSIFKKIKASETLFINELAEKLSAEGRHLYRFGFGQSPFPPPPSVIKALRDNADKHAYLQVQGLLELRNAVAKFHSFEGQELSGNNVFIGPGSKILIYSILAAFREAEVFLPAPTWVSYKPQADLCNHSSYYLETTFEGRWRVTAEQLKRFCVMLQARRETNLPGVAIHEQLGFAYDAASKPKIMILTYPGNPDGMTYTADELKAIAQVAREYRILIISDEIYGFMNHNNNHISIRDYYPEGTIVTTGLSKWCGAGGWRIGVAILPDPSISIYPALKATLIGVASELYSSTAAPIQYAAIEAYKRNSELEEYMSKQRDILAKLGNYCAEQLSMADLRVHPPEGGFYVFPDFENYRDKFRAMGIETSIDMCNRLLEDLGITVLPATAFGHRPDLLACRLSYTDFDGKTALAASNGDVDTEFLQQYCANVVEGITKLVEWLK